VTDAIQAFLPLPGVAVVRPTASDRSIIYKWGVRVTWDSRGTRSDAWICCATSTCRTKQKYIALYGKTSNATQHLKTCHDITAKMRAGGEQERSDLDRMRDSLLNRGEPNRLRLLLETHRIVVNNIPRTFVDFPESRLAHEVMACERYSGSVTHLTVAHSIVELYASVVKELMPRLHSAKLATGRSLAIATDICYSNSTRTTILGIRVFCITSEWSPISFFIGARHIQHEFSKDNRHIREQFMRWVTCALGDFGLSDSDFFAGIADANNGTASDMQNQLGIQSERCLARLAGYGARVAFGISSNEETSANPVMTQLITAVVVSVYAVRAVDGMTSVSTALKQFLNVERDRAVCLAPDVFRLIALTDLIEAVLEKWEQMELLLETRVQGVCDGYPLAGRKLDLIHSLSLLKPLKHFIQKTEESAASSTCVILVSLCRLRMTTLDTSKPLRNRWTAPEGSRDFAPHELSPMTTKARFLLRDIFDRVYFSRYTTHIDSSPFLFEMQMMLDPVFKAPCVVLEKIVALCNEQTGSSSADAGATAMQVTNVVQDRVASVMLSIARQSVRTPLQSAVTTLDSSFSEELVNLLFPPTSECLDDDLIAASVIGELKQWLKDPVLVPGGTPQAKPVLQFWAEQSRSTKYNYLPIVARAIFSVPPSTLLLHDDFEVIATTVASKQSDEIPISTDLCAFLRVNRVYIDLLQCPPLTSDQRINSLPRHALISFTPHEDNMDRTDVKALMAGLGE
jgi:hypothetical protein